MIIIGVSDRRVFARMVEEVYSFVNKYLHVKGVSVYVPGENIPYDEAADLLEVGSNFFDGLRIIAPGEEAEVRIGVVTDAGYPIMYFSAFNCGRVDELIIIFHDAVFVRKFMRQITDDFCETKHRLEKILSTIA